MNPQSHCLLFAVLSAELRIPVYRAALTDPYRFLHICKNLHDRFPDHIMSKKKKAKQRPAAHFWCIDMESPFPTWQHECYQDGNRKKPGEAGVAWRPITETGDKLLSLLLTCRLIYNEALPILYQYNTFHFRGSPGVLAFRPSLSAVQWQHIRRIHIFTEWILNGTMNDALCPPENLSKWERCCNYLAELPNLDYLKLEIIARDYIDSRSGPRIADIAIGAHLGFVKGIVSRNFEVELNVELSQEARDDLGEVNFVTTVKERPCNVKLYHPLQGIVC